VIDTPVDAATLSLIDGIASARGVSRETVTSELVRQAADGAVLRVAIAEGRGQIAAGRYLDDQAFPAEVERRRRTRQRAA